MLSAIGFVACLLFAVLFFYWWYRVVADNDDDDEGGGYGGILGWKVAMAMVILTSYMKEAYVDLILEAM